MNLDKKSNSLYRRRFLRSLKGKIEVKKVEQAIVGGGADNLSEIAQIISDTGGLNYTQTLAKEEIKKAQSCLSALPDSEYKTAMQTLANFAVNRHF